MAKRLVNLLRMTKSKGDVLVTGGLSKNVGFVAAMQELADQDKRLNIKVLTHKDSTFAGSIGAAIWGGYRHVILQKKQTAKVA